MKIKRGVDVDLLTGIKEGYFSYVGRLNRKIYIIRILILLMIIHFASLMNTAQSDFISNIIGMIIIIASIIAIFMLGIRRLHDLGKQWYWILAMLIPIVNLGLLIYLAIIVGEDTENEYGPNPLENVGAK